MKGATNMYKNSVDNGSKILNIASMKNKNYEDENLDALLQEFGFETDDNENVDIATMDEIEDLEIFNQ